MSKQRIMALLLVLFLTPVQAMAEGPKPATMQELLERVRTGWQNTQSEAKLREQEFRDKKQEQAALLEQAKKDVAALELRSTELEQSFQQGEVKIAELEDTLKATLGNMGELFGVIRQIAGDTRGHLDESMVSAEKPGRQAALDPLSSSKTIPAVDDLKQLWVILQEEMVESGRVSRFDTPVVLPNGEEASKTVTRVGVFNAVADGEYLTWLSDVQKLSVLGRQPKSRYLDTAEDLSAGTGGPIRFAVDPSRGSILSLLVQTPSVSERLQFGGIIGYIILTLGGLTFLGGLVRLLQLLVTSGKVKSQLRAETPDDGNPLGRVLGIYQKHRELEPEALELKLDEAILREQAQADRFLWAVKVVAAAAPLMGLLGTVTGMIRTFQAITLFGTGDPKLMAGGISEALVTTMLGLVVAIPLVLLHSFLKTLSRRIMETLGEQSIGMVATRAEKANHVG